MLNYVILSCLWIFILHDHVFNHTEQFHACFQEFLILSGKGALSINWLTWWKLRATECIFVRNLLNVLIWWAKNFNAISSTILMQWPTQRKFFIYAVKKSSFLLNISLLWHNCLIIATFYLLLTTFNYFSILYIWPF